MPQWILASISPRRAVLLRRVLADFTVFPAEVPELTGDSGLAAELIPAENARRKACAVAEIRPSCCVIGADTAICYGGTLIGKPRDLDEARAILTMLSGRVHQVVTGVAVVDAKQRFERVWSESAQVFFKPFDRSVIERYLSLVPVLDKAGAYAIQQHGEMLVDHFTGELETIIGLPLKRLQTLIGEINSR